MVNKSFGVKADGLIKMRDNGINVPPFIISGEDSLLNFIDTNKVYSVRPSTNITLPGILPTYLNVSSLNEINKCVKNINDEFNTSNGLSAWASIHNIKKDDITLSIIIQEMIDPKQGDNNFSGVCMTINPYTFENNLFGRVVKSNTGDCIMSGEYRGEDINELDEKILMQIQDNANKIKNIYNKDQEIEFVVYNGIVYILQCRDAILYGTNLINNEIFDVSNLQKLYSFHNYDNRMVADKVAKNDYENGILIVENIKDINLNCLKNKSAVISKYGNYCSHYAAILRQLNIPYAIIENIDISLEYDLIIDFTNGVVYKR